MSTFGRCTSRSRSPQTQEARTLARGVEENVVRTVEAVDQALRFLQAIHRRDPDGFDLLDWSSLYELGDGLAVQLAQIGADGIMVASDRSRGGAPVNLADREHFRVHLGSTRTSCSSASRCSAGSASNGRSSSPARCAWRMGASPACW